MSTYAGTAVLLLDDGRQFDAAASLSKDASGTWNGTLAFHDQALAPVLLNVDSGHILVNGRPGEFIRPDRSDWTVNGGDPFVIRILGSGEAPF